MKLSMMVLRNVTSAPVAPLLKGQGGNAPAISPLSGVRVLNVCDPAVTDSNTKLCLILPLSGWLL